MTGIDNNIECMSLEQDGMAFTGLINDKIVAAAGMKRIWGNVAEGWFLAKNAKHWLQYELPERTNLMVVMQGTTIGEMHQLYQQCVDLGYTHFAFNHSSILYQELCPTENKLANQTVGRVLLLENMKDEKLIKPHHYIHLLGCSVPQEFTHYRDNWEPGMINSVDTSNPIICGALGIRYDEIGLLEKPSNKIEEFMESNLEDKLEDIKYNVQCFKNFCNK